MLSGEKQVGRVKVIAEGYLARGGGLVSGGLRATRGRGSFDFGVATLLGDGQTFVVPIFRIAWNL
jgi:hypothetical protein